MLIFFLQNSLILNVSLNEKVVKSFKSHFPKKVEKKKTIETPKTSKYLLFKFNSAEKTLKKILKNFPKFLKYLAEFKNFYKYSLICHVYTQFSRKKLKKF